MWLPHSFVVFLLAASASGAIINTTVDDSSSQFSFVGTWNTITPASPCSICSSQPNSSLVFDGTWHDGNIRDGAPVGTSGSFTFTGSAVYIIGIDQALSQPDIAFTLGSISSVHHYTGTEQFVYNAVFFSATGLPSDQKQTVNWIFNVADTTVPVQAALFDYAIVTSGEDDPPPPPPSSSTTPKSSPTTSSSNKATSTTHSSGSSTASSTISSSSTGIKSSSASSTDSSESTPSSMTVTTNAAGEIITVTASARVSAQLRSTSNSNLGTIIGGVVGALACCVLIIVFLWLRLRRRMRRIEPETDKAARTQFLRLEDYPLHSTSTLPRTNAQEEGQSVPISLSTSGSKIRHRNNASVTGASNTTLSSPTEGHATTVTPSDPPRPIPDEPPAAAPANTPANSSAANLQVLEERVAMLEALTVNQHPPPAYVDEDDD